MKAILLVLALVGLSSPRSAVADDRSPTFHVSRCDGPVRLQSRRDVREAGFAITSEEGHLNLLIDRGVVVAQFSDRGLRDMRRELRKRESDEDNPLAFVIQSVALNVVAEILDHGAECRVRDLKRVTYEGDRLVFTTEDGDEIFDGIEVNDQELTRSFSEHDARAFVREFRRVKAQRR